MHAVVMDSLEDYLSGTLEPVAQRSIEAHLSTCESCLEQLHSMQDMSQLFGSLRTEEVFEPTPSFYVGVMQQIGVKRATPSFASLFALDFTFGRRLVFTSLMMMAVLGGYLVSRESEYPGGPSPEAVMAQQESPAFDANPAQDNMLVTLTAYEQR